MALPANVNCCACYDAANKYTPNTCIGHIFNPNKQYFWSSCRCTSTVNCDWHLIKCPSCIQIIAPPKTACTSCATRVTAYLCIGGCGKVFTKPNCLCNSCLLNGSSPAAWCADKSCGAPVSKVGDYCAAHQSLTGSSLSFGPPAPPVTGDPNFPYWCDNLGCTGMVKIPNTYCPVCCGPQPNPVPPPSPAPLTISSVGSITITGNTSINHIATNPWLAKTITTSAILDNIISEAGAGINNPREWCRRIAEGYAGQKIPVNKPLLQDFINQNVNSSRSAEFKALIQEGLVTVAGWYDGPTEKYVVVLADGIVGTPIVTLMGVVEFKLTMTTNTSLRAIAMKWDEFEYPTRKKVPTINKWPHICTSCKSPALLLFSSVDCSNGGCKHYKGPEYKILAFGS